MLNGALPLARIFINMISYQLFIVELKLPFNVMNVINNNNLKKINYKTVYFPQKTVSRYKHFLSLRLSSQAKENTCCLL